MIRNNAATSWIGYMNYLKQQTIDPEQLTVDGLEGIMEVNSYFHAAFSHSVPWLYLLDYTTGRYLMVSKTMKLITGYESDYWQQGGLNLTLERYQKDHLKLFNEEIFPDRLEILKKIPPAEHPNYVFSYNFQLKSRSGQPVTLLQRNCFVKSDESGNPLLSFGVVTNVNNYTNENPVIHLVEKVTEGALLGIGEAVEKKTYYIQKENGLFSKRQKELLLYMADGLTSKEIADKLFISEHTVINHRRNMMEKCNVRNAIELVAYAIRHRII
ncbi:DNA-binding response regulator [Chitinophaga silvatica]|uniref:DNA-binding response regulator n=1 Tax=Chitinophaga silvatica TaxID=2282649 RepID=A0A3E1Y4B3_9BACT|nr:response regulator transcription factor [Chitinophaga silvatica]RFS19462.1 DNA-binding response regulator [Chitinophaga silvatica]